MTMSRLGRLALIAWAALSPTAALAEGLPSRPEGVSGPFAWRIAGLRRTHETVDGREHEILWMTLLLTERAGRVWTINGYEARARREGFTEAPVTDTGPWRVRPQSVRGFRIGTGAPCGARPDGACGVPLDRPLAWSVVMTGTDDGGRPFRTVIDFTLAAALYAGIAPAPPMRVHPIAAGTTSSSLPITNSRAHLMTVEATLAGGQRVTLLLDTGAQMTLLTPEVAARAGLVLSAEGDVFSITLATGSDATVATTMLPSLRLGGFVVENLEVGVAPLPGFGEGAGPIGGLLGADVLEQFTFTVDPRAGRLRLELVR